MRVSTPTALWSLALAAGVMSLAGCGSAPATNAEDRANVPSAEAAPADLLIKPSESAEPVPAPAAAGQLPLPLGYYAVNTECSALQDANLGVVIEPDLWRDVDGDYELLPIQDLGGGKFKLGEAADTLRKIGPNSFLVDEGTEYQRELHWCAEQRPE